VAVRCHRPAASGALIDSALRMGAPVELVAKATKRLVDVYLDTVELASAARRLRRARAPRGRRFQRR